MFSLYRAGFYLCHIQVIVSKMGQQVVKGTAGMVYFKANADLFGIFQKIFWFVTIMNRVELLSL